MLEAAGLVFKIVPADIDEDAIREGLLSDSACVDPDHVATILAAEKALAVSRQHPHAVVIGSDQVLALGTRLIAKAANVTEAREILDTLRGRTHELFSAVAIAEQGEVTWSHVSRAQLTMRRFTDEFLGRYIAQNDDAVVHAVGAYEIEGRGIHLFEAIEGDHFTILGMPLLPLLAELRSRGLVAA